MSAVLQSFSFCLPSKDKVKYYGMVHRENKLNIVKWVNENEACHLQQPATDYATKNSF